MLSCEFSYQLSWYLVDRDLDRWTLPRISSDSDCDGSHQNPILLEEGRWTTRNIMYGKEFEWKYYALCNCKSNCCPKFALIFDTRQNGIYKNRRNPPTKICFTLQLEIPKIVVHFKLIMICIQSFEIHFSFVSFHKCDYNKIQ